MEDCNSHLRYFWVISGTSSALGLIFFHEISLLEYNKREILALAFAALFSFSCFQLQWSKQNAVEAVGIFGAMGCIIVSIFFILHIIIHTKFPHIFTYGSGVRFSGLSQNPNQLALLLSVAPFCSLVILRNYSWSNVLTIKNSILAVCFVISLVAGYFSKSSALLLGWALAALLLLANYYIFQKKTPQLEFIRTFLLASISLTILFCWFFSFQFQLFNPTGDVPFYSLNQKFYSEIGSMEVRLLLLTNGFEALSYSPFFGFGPGTFSGLEEPFQGSEAHNTILDWSLSFGLLGGLLLIILFLKIACGMFVSNQIEILAALIAVGIFAQFHYILRQPLVWYVLFLLISISCSANRSCKAKCVV